MPEAEASFAGAFESVLDVRTDEEIPEAIRRVRRSRHADRVAAYGEAQGLRRREQEAAVVVQRFIRADFAGVLFTVDPVSGDTALMTGNVVHSSGDSLVSGQANPLSFTFSRPGGRYEGPAELRRIAPELYRTARTLERRLGGPQDIEFALAEQAPEVRTPFSCSMLKALDSLPAPRIGSHSLTGIIGGRAYSNLSVPVSAYRPLFGGDTHRALKMLSATFGDIPIVPLSRWTWWTKVLPGLLAYVRRMRRLTGEIPRFVEKNPSWCSGL